MKHETSGLCTLLKNLKNIGFGTLHTYWKAVSEVECRSKMKFKIDNILTNFNGFWQRKEQGSSRAIHTCVLVQEYKTD